MSQLFTEDDLYRPADEGRSLHDEARSFFQKWIPTANQGNLPKLEEMDKAVCKALSDGSDTSTMKFLNNLKSTTALALWPENNTGLPPTTTIGILWQAVHNCSMIKHDYNDDDNENNGNMSDGSPVRMTEVATPPNNTMLTTTRIDVGASTQSSSPKKRGRQPGTKKWSDTEVDILLNATEKVLPAGSEMWELVTQTCQLKKADWARPGSSCKSKFENLAFMKKPTGSTEVPIFIQRAKQIKERIAGSECIGFSYSNEDDYEKEDDLYSESETDRSLKAARLEPSRPATKTKKTAVVLNAIGDLAASTKEGAGGIAAAIEKLTNAYSHSNDSHLAGEIRGLRGNLEVQETRLGRLENSLGQISTQLEKIIGAVAPQQKNNERSN